MPKRVILVSGAVCSGKTTLARQLTSQYGFQLLKTRLLLESALGDDGDRRDLQAKGAALDRKTRGQWVVDALIAEGERHPADAVFLVDAVRRDTQIEAIRRAFGSRVVHIHLTAPQDVLAERYASREATFPELPTYQDVADDKTERHARRLYRKADIVLDTSNNAESDVLARASGLLGLYGRSVDRLVDVLVGGQYGSEGKGHVSSYLAQDYDVLIRVGGPNAGHWVYEEPKPYCHHHLPCGTRSTQARLVIGPGAVLRVPNLLKEIRECKVGVDRLIIDPNAMTIEDDDIAFEKKTLKRSIGSTAQGVGAATSRKVLRKAAKPKVRLARDVPDLQPYLKEALGVLEQAYARGQRALLEGTQGTGLSIHHGAYPYVTSRDTSASGCLAEAGIASSRVRRIVMVCRSLVIRVESPSGATSGPMNQELTWEEVSERSGVPIEELREKEKTSTTKRDRRVGEFEWNLLRRASSLNGPTDIALTFADYVSVRNSKARRFEQLTEPTRNFIEEIERVAAAPVSLITTRFHYRSIIDRRAW